MMCYIDDACDVSAPSLDSKSFESVGYSPWRNYRFENIKYLKNPTIGSQTLAWTSGGTYRLSILILLFYKDADPNNPIYGYSIDAAKFTSNPAILSGFSYDTIGLTIGFASADINSLGDETFTRDGQTIIATCNNYT